jgi:hypothetical protein
LDRIASRYHRQLARPPGNIAGATETAGSARQYLRDHGIDDDSIIEKYRLGVVLDPLPDDERFSGMLCIPYLSRRGGVKAIKYRTLTGNGPKCAQYAGQEARLYNTMAWFEADTSIGLTEGEADAICATERLGLPSMGVPGAEVWAAHERVWKIAFKDYATVFVLCDGDQPGRELGKQVSVSLGWRARVIHLPDGQDVSSMVASGRSGWFEGRLTNEDDESELRLNKSRALRPFFSFYGSKWRLARLYPKPLYDTIIEPFAGSAGYSLLHSDREILLIDRDPVIAAVWRWLISATPDDILSLPRLKQGESLDDYDMPQEARWLMGFWIHQAGTTPSRRCTGRGVTRQRHDRVAHQLQYIRHWAVIEGSYSDAPNIAATWFIDPPYQDAGKIYRYGSPTIDYASLGAWCRDRDGQVMVCENACAEWLPFNGFATHQGLTQNGAVQYSEEAVWFCEKGV